jgi:hypothetical protein
MLRWTDPAAFNQLSRGVPVLVTPKLILRYEFTAYWIEDALYSMCWENSRDAITFATLIWMGFTWSEALILVLPFNSRPGNSNV